MTSFDAALSSLVACSSSIRANTLPESSPPLLGLPPAGLTPPLFLSLKDFLIRLRAVKDACAADGDDTAECGGGGGGRNGDIMLGSDGGIMAEGGGDGVRMDEDLGMRKLDALPALLAKD